MITGIGLLAKTEVVHIADGWCIVGTGDGHGDFLSRAIARGVGNRIVHSIQSIQILNRGLIQRVSPGSTSQNEATIGIITQGGRYIIERGGIIDIHIANR